jgi:hypothetical protein
MMSIQDWGAIGEVVGAIGVIATLVYLAIQIRQSTAMARMAALQNIIKGGVEHNRGIADSESLARIITKGVDDPESLSNDERLRFNANAITLYHHLDAAYQMYECGLLDAESWRGFAYEAAIWIRLPGIRDWFETDKHRLSPGFRKYLEQALETEEMPKKVPGFGRELKEASHQ